MSRSRRSDGSHRDYYVILGVSRNAEPAAIRKAFQELAKRLHPDRAGGHSTAAFQQVSEAYGVLSDPAARRRYDAQLQRAARREAQQRRGRPVRPMAVEPLDVRAPTGRSSLGSWEPSRAGSPASPTLEGSPVREPAEAIVVLDSRRAAAGGPVVLDLPTLEPCSRCDGRGGRWPFPCIRCGGSGLVRRRARFMAHLPAGLGDGSVVELRGPAGHPLRLRVRLRPGR